MNKQLILIAIALIGYAVSASAVSYNGAHFQGIGKLAGKPLDYWIDIEMDDEDADISIGELYRFTGAYTASGTASNPAFTVNIPHVGKVIFKSTDKGESYTGTFRHNNETIQLWVIKVPRKLKASKLPDNELYDIIGSPDGYTCFAQLETRGLLTCVTSDFSFRDGSFDMMCDSSEVQKMFSNFNGTYSVEEGNLNLVTTNGSKLVGKIYDNGKYLEIPVGSKSGMTLKLILIR